MFQEVTGIQTNLIARPEQCPVFILPDISGNPASLLGLAKHLQKALNNQTQLYVWNVWSSPLSLPFGKSLASYANHVANEIVATFPEGPYNLAGYSYGGSLGFMVAQSLMAQGKEVSLYVIDSPSIGLSQQYFQAGNKKASFDLVSIFNYLGRLVSNHNPQLENQLNPDEFCQLSIKGQLDLLKDKLVEAFPDPRIGEKLSHYADVAIHNLRSLLTHGMPLFDEQEQKHIPNTQPVPLLKIGFASSTESNEKHEFNIAKSWDVNYCDTVESKEIPDSSHFSLMAESKSEFANGHSASGQCEQVAEHMANFFKSSIRPEKLAAMKLKAIDPNLDFTQVFELYKKMQATTSPTGSVSSTSSVPLANPANRSPVISAFSIASTVPSSPSDGSLSPDEPQMDDMEDRDEVVERKPGGGHNRRNNSAPNARQIGFAPAIGNSNSRTQTSSNFFANGMNLPPPALKLPPRTTRYQERLIDSREDVLMESSMLLNPLIQKSQSAHQIQQQSPHHSPHKKHGNSAHGRRR